MAEWNGVFSHGPGIVVFRGTYNDLDLINDVTAVLNDIIERERDELAGSGDHFAAAGANSRVWNAHEKLCMASPTLFARYNANHVLDLISHYYVRGGQEQLWRISAVPKLYDETDGWKPLIIWGMGIASRDIDGDGLPEIFLTSMGDQKLWALMAGGEAPTYQDASLAHGTTAHVPYVGDEGRPSSGWHAAFGDVDNDGLDDLSIAKGNVEQMPDAAMRDPNNLLMQESPGRFTEFGDRAGLATTERARGAAVADLNRDGKLDIVVNNRQASLELNENITDETGQWLAVDLRQIGISSWAVGSWIEVTDGKRSWHREVTVGGGHAGGMAGFHHFGTGKSTSLRLRVLWQDGMVSPWHHVHADRHVRVERHGQAVKIVSLFQASPK